MLWHFEHEDLSGFKLAHVSVPQTAIAMATVQDYCDQIDASEQAELAPMAQTRRLGFSSGRYCARLAQQALGLPPKPVLREQRVPIWPIQCVGSITHSDHIAVASTSQKCRGVGVDIEQNGRVEAKLYRILFTPDEQLKLDQYLQRSPAADTIMFSAKEAGYKAIYPIGKRFIGFREAEINLCYEDSSFTIKYLGDHQANKVLEQGLGYWREHRDHILTIFYIP